MRRSRCLRFTSVVFLIASLSAGAATAAVCTPAAQWQSRASLSAPVIRAWGAFFPPNGKFYAMGGRASDAIGSDYTHPFEYDPGADSWATKAATFPSNQVNNMVGGVLTVGATKYIYLVGGSAAGSTTASTIVQRYDPLEDSLTTITLDPWPGNNDGLTLPGGAAVFNNKLYVFGGFRTNIAMVDGIYQFDPNAAAGSRWTKMSSVLPFPRGYIPTAATGAHIYLLGGSNFDSNVVADSADAFSFDPVGDKIGLLASVPRVVGETRAIAQRNGTLWVLGGGRTAPNPSSEVDVFRPGGSDTWTTATALPNAGRNFSADVDPATGNIWVAGGYGPDGTTPSTVTEQYCGDTLFGNGFDAW